VLSGPRPLPGSSAQRRHLARRRPHSLADLWGQRLQGPARPKRPEGADLQDRNRRSGDCNGGVLGSCSFGRSGNPGSSPARLIRAVRLEGSAGRPPRFIAFRPLVADCRSDRWERLNWSPSRSDEQRSPRAYKCRWVLIQASGETLRRLPAHRLSIGRRRPASGESSGVCWSDRLKSRRSPAGWIAPAPINAMHPCRDQRLIADPGRAGGG